jgi:hypothetical protein
MKSNCWLLQVEKKRDFKSFIWLLFFNNLRKRVIKTVMKYHLKKIDTSLYQPLPNMVQRLFADVINDAI